MKSTDTLSVLAATERLLTGLVPLESEIVGLEQSLGRVLAQHVLASTSLPPFDNSAMDGFAVRAADVRSATRDRPIVLKVSGDIPAGAVEVQPLASGEAVRIMTGARMPVGADAVVPVERTSSAEPMAGQQLPERVAIMSPVGPGEYVRREGIDVLSGHRVIQAGVRLAPAHIGMLASLGLTEVTVHRLPRLALISTGDELVDIDQPLRPGQIRDGNGYALAAAVRQAGGVPLRLGIVGDDLDALVERLEEAVASGADVILSSAGVSLGAYDFVRSAVERQGRLDFWKVNIRPGKPLVSGSFKGVPFVGLPGNPVSALVTFEVFVRPMIDRLAGLTVTTRARLTARVSERVSSDGRESYLRGSLNWEGGEYRVRLAGSQDSSVLSSMIRANALIVLPAGVRPVEIGEEVEV